MLQQELFWRDAPPGELDVVAARASQVHPLPGVLPRLDVESAPTILLCGVLLRLSEEGLRVHAVLPALARAEVHQRVSGGVISVSLEALECSAQRLVRPRRTPNLIGVVVHAPRCSARHGDLFLASHLRRQIESAGSGECRKSFAADEIPTEARLPRAVCAPVVHQVDAHGLAAQVSNHPRQDVDLVASTDDSKNGTAHRHSLSKCSNRSRCSAT